MPILGELREDNFHLRDKIALIDKRNLISHTLMYDISRPPEVCNDRNSATGQGLKDHARAKIANRRKQHYIGGPQLREHVRMVHPTPEVDRVPNAKG